MGDLQAGAQGGVTVGKGLPQYPQVGEHRPGEEGVVLQPTPPGPVGGWWMRVFLPVGGDLHQGPRGHLCQMGLDGLSPVCLHGRGLLPKIVLRLFYHTHQGGTRAVWTGLCSIWKFLSSNRKDRRESR